MEVVIVLIAAILIFGHRLPQVAAQAGAQLGKLRRTLDSAWKDSGADHEVREMQDVGARELLIFVPVVLLVLWIGLYPKPYLHAMDASVAQLIQQTQVSK